MRVMFGINYKYTCPKCFNILLALLYNIKLNFLKHYLIQKSILKQAGKSNYKFTNKFQDRKNYDY